MVILIAFSVNSIINEHHCCRYSRPKQLPLQPKSMQLLLLPLHCYTWHCNDYADGHNHGDVAADYSERIDSNDVARNYQYDDTYDGGNNAEDDHHGCDDEDAGVGRDDDSHDDEEAEDQRIMMRCW